MLILKHLKTLQHVSRYAPAYAGAYLSTHNARTHTKRYAATSPHLTFDILNIFLNSVTLTRNIRAP